jgi:UDP-N-acetylmuramate--alanine ligase
MRHMPVEIGTLHFVGIGGIGMSGIAEILHALGYSVQGSDIAESPNVVRLREKGMNVHIGHKGENIKGAAVLVVSSAIKKDNPELVAARAEGILIVRRAEMLAELMRMKWSFAIGGTHGKTTTTSMVGTMLEAGNFDPTVINGGIVNSYGTNVRLGDGDFLVAESDESDGTFTRLPACVAVITNMDPEHMEHYGSFDNVRKAYRQFVMNLPFYGYAVLCTDHPEVQTLIPELSDRRIVTYGFNSQADVRGVNVRATKDGMIFDVEFGGHHEGALKDVFLPMHGKHNVQNALVAVAIAHEMEMPAALIKKGMESFSGVKRRFTKTGETQGVSVIDDYGHHPVEISAVLKAARDAAGEGRVIAVMQPHRYSRLHDLMDEFSTCFNDADSVIIADVYAAGEDPIEGADKQHLADGIRKHGHRDVKTLESAEKLPQMLATMVEDGDFVICLGAGDITKWAYALPKQLETVLDSAKKQRA